ncbi:class III lanthipeptide [Actinokineospora bangkokensis]|nr:class III lanthipeptide [Actinokineospora bangkokensis]
MGARVDTVLALQELPATAVEEVELLEQSGLSLLLCD